MGSCCCKDKNQSQQSQDMILKAEQEIQELERIVGATVFWHVKDNNDDWRAYDTDANDQIGSLDMGQSWKYTSKENNQTYEIKKISPFTAEQTNIITKSKREVKRMRIVNNA